MTDPESPPPSEEQETHADTTRTGAPQSSTRVETIDRYRLLQKIGTGGMGEVYLAEQVEPVRRRVALKLVKAGMDTDHVLARFEAERQALAMMEHPCVAKVLDAGSTPQGRPYFAMEYVSGVTITEHCDRHRSTLRQRLAIFLEVCEGVQHAHQKAILHRDLKPSNILVSEQDGKATPKIIDFGVAKATAQPLTERTLFTELGVLIGTPEYMSPEQANRGGEDVDTRTDVYSLGVVLYELMVGALPFEPKRMREGDVETIRRMIRDEEPPKPSARLSTLDVKRSTESASRRQEDLANLRRDLRGDLDWIVMKAIEKDRSRRYGSVAELAADIRRHLANQPVLARPPSAGYRAGKFLRRHRVGATMTSIAVIASIGVIAALLVQNARITREARTKERTLDFLTQIFEVSEPGEARGNAVTAREILDRGAEKIRKELQGEPVVRAELMFTIAVVYSGLGLDDRAAALHREALEIRKAVLGPEHLATLTSMNALGVNERRLGHFQAAEEIEREAVETRTRLLGPHHPDTLISVNNLATVYNEEGKYAEAETLHRSILEERLRTIGREHRSVATALLNLASDHVNQGRFTEAESLYRQAIEIQDRVRGADHPETLLSKSGLGIVLKALGRYSEAEALDGETVEAQRRVLGPEHPNTLVTMNNLATLYLDTRRYQEAEELNREVLEIRRRTLGLEHPATVNSMANLANALGRLGRSAEAEALVREVVEVRTRVLGAKHPDTLGSRNNLGRLLTLTGREEEGEKILLANLSVEKRVLPADHPSTLIAVDNLAYLYAKQGRRAEAEAFFGEEFEAQKRVLGPRHPRALTTAYNLACMAALRGAREEGLARLKQAVADGYKDVERLRKDPDLASLRGTSEFDALVAAATANQEKSKAPK